MSLKASPKPQCPYKISALKSPLAASFAAAVGTGTPPSSDEPDPRPLLLLPQDPETPLRLIKQGPGRRSVQSAANPSAHGLPPNPIRQGPGPLRPISGPRRCCLRCRREYARLRDLPRCGDPPPAISTRCGDPPIAKTKISASLQLFCDCELFPVPAKRKRSLHTANYLHFCASIRNWEARNNCQSQKSCNLSRFFVSGLLG